MNQLKLKLAVAMVASSFIAANAQQLSVGFGLASSHSDYASTELSNTDAMYADNGYAIALDYYHPLWLNDRLGIRAGIMFGANAFNTDGYASSLTASLGNTIGGVVDADGYGWFSIGAGLGYEYRTGNFAFPLGFLIGFGSVATPNIDVALNNGVSLSQKSVGATGVTIMGDIGLKYYFSDKICASLVFQSYGMAFDYEY